MEINIHSHCNVYPPPKKKKFEKPISFTTSFCILDLNALVQVISTDGCKVHTNKHHAQIFKKKRGGRGGGDPHPPWKIKMS